jgi:hypothetical protein
VRVCYFWASTGSFYRHGRERELGHELGAVAGKSRARRLRRGAVDAWGVRAGTMVLTHALWRGMTASATASSRALWSGDREAEVVAFPPSTGRGSGLLQ